MTVSDTGAWLARPVAVQDAWRASAERFDDPLLILARQTGMERDRHRASARVLADRAQALGEPVALAHVGLEVDRRQVRRARDPLRASRAQHAVAVDAARAA